jgi:hypothetical protein
MSFKIVVLSPDALRDPLHDFGGEAARAIDPAARERKLLPLLLKPCELPDWVGTLRLKVAGFTDEKTRAAEMARLVRSIQYTLPPPPALPERPGALWRWWQRYYHRPIAADKLPLQIGMLATLDMTRPPRIKREFERLATALLEPLPRR